MLRCSVPRALQRLLFLELEGWPKKKRAEKSLTSIKTKVFNMQLCAVNRNPAASISDVHAF